MIDNEDQSSVDMMESEDQPVEEIQAEAPPALDDEAAEPAPVAQPRLVIKRAGVETDEVFPFMCPAVIGRFDPSVGPVDIDLGTIEEGTYVSRKHAKITEENGVYKIADLGSSNGTYVSEDGDFKRVDEAEIHSGEEIAFGNARVVFYV